jgi:hypothetical protein
MQLLTTPHGTVVCIYSEELDLTPLGSLSITRASHVEPNPLGRWQADLSPVGGPLLGEFRTRSEALAAEIAWMTQHLPRISRSSTARRN